ncbi:MAG: 23S rRNA (adenine(2503)-C(2))-methyltransferase RlmN [Bdellovibrio sp.]|nr:23S rRNA (adenine(2503)-C(2))-methyltransferase RlmN [Bdellovibrio sp.]
MLYFQSFTLDALALILRPQSLTDERRARMRARQIFQWVYQKGAVSWDEMTDLSKDLRSWLKENVAFYNINKKESKQSIDGTHKFLWELEDHKTIESVIIPANKEERITACISTQVGCAMGCKFCLTGVQGLSRNLKTYEIIAQVYELRKIAQVTNIVFMGMGEPLHNLENLITACQILLDPYSFGFSKRKVTVSTSGIVPAIEKLGKQISVSLAVSLNAVTDEKRSKIMPVNKKWNLALLLKACKDYSKCNRRITFEYVLLKDFNDSLEDAARLVKLVRGIPCKINLIPMNEHTGSVYKRPTEVAVRAFQKYLLDRHMTATVRISKGVEILAACGQLSSVSQKTCVK